MVTVEESIWQKIEGAKKWREANPGLPWRSQEHPEDEEKIYITKELVESKAYRSLSRCALLIYQDFLEKRIMKRIKREKQKVWIIENNGAIIYPYQEAEQRGFTRQQFRDAIDELQEKGLIDIKHLGKGGRKPAEGTGDMTTYWIDDRWKDYGTDAFKPARNPRTRDKRKSRGWALINSDPARKKAIEKKRKATIRKKVRCEKTHQLEANECEKTHQLRAYNQTAKFS